ncbi:MAG: EcsC family protein [Candidatus Lindowbacteria bacterium]|nr:EcsC family protein [Candidatus Lindowbacteria bacterium]
MDKEPDIEILPAEEVPFVREIDEGDLSSYEEKVILQIATHTVRPSFVSRALEMAGKPIEKVLEAAATSNIKPIQIASQLVHTAVDKALRASLLAASRISTDQVIAKEAKRSGLSIRNVDDLRTCSLQDLDRLADRFDRGNSIVLGAEGALMGAATSLAEGIPGAQVLIPSLIATDVAASMTLLSKHAGQVASCYGYSPRVPANRFHIIASMAPQSESPDEGYFTAKAAALETILEASAFVGSRSARMMNRKLMEKESPRLVRLISYVSRRLGIILTEKELGMLVPLAGAVLNGGLNVAFQKVGHSSAKDYFRLMYLEEKYGMERIRTILDQAIVLKKKKFLS